MLELHISVASVPAEKAGPFLQAAFDASDAAQDPGAKALAEPLVAAAITAVQAVPAGQAVSVSVVAQIRLDAAPAA